MESLLLEQLKHKTIFQHLEPHDWNHLLSISTVHLFPKNAIVFYQGDASNYLHILLDGKVQIYKHNANGHEVILKEFSSPSLVAQLANLEEIAFPSNCMATQESQILLTDYAKFKAYFLNNPKFLLIFIKSLTTRVLELENLLSNHLTLDAKAKVAKFIYQNEKLFNLKSNIEIAKMLNITPETLSRTIKKLRQEGAIDTQNAQLSIVSHDMLKRYF